MSLTGTALKKDASAQASGNIEAATKEQAMATRLNTAALPETNEDVRLNRRHFEEERLTNIKMLIDGWTQPGVWVCTRCKALFLVKQGRPVPNCHECGNPQATRCPENRIVPKKLIEDHYNLVEALRHLMPHINKEQMQQPLRLVVDKIESIIAGKPNAPECIKTSAENESENDDQESQKERKPEPERKTYMCDTCGDILSTKQLIEGHICTNCGGHWKPWPEYVTIHMNEYLEYLKLKKKIEEIQKLAEKWKCTKKMDEDDPSCFHCPAHYADYPCRCDNDQRDDILKIINRDDSHFYEKIRKIDEVLAEENGGMW